MCVLHWSYYVSLQVLNLFLALMLNSFATDSINKNKEKMAENKKMKQGWKKLKGLFKSKQKVSPDFLPNTQQLALILEIASCVYHYW